MRTGVVFFRLTTMVLLVAGAGLVMACSNSATNPTPCTMDTECQGLGLLNPYCNTAQGTCMDRGACTSDDQCAAFLPDAINPMCNGTGTCMDRGACANNEQCGTGYVCQPDGRCRPAGFDGDLDDESEQNDDQEPAEDGDLAEEEELGPQCPNLAGNYDVTVQCGSSQTGVASIVQPTDSCDVIIYYPGGVLTGVVDINGTIATEQDKRCRGTVTDGVLNLKCPDESCVINGGGATTSGTIMVDPRQIDFGNAQPTLNYDEDVTISNTGDDPLTIYAIATGGSAKFSVDLGAVALPKVLSKGEQIVVKAKFYSAGEYIEEEGDLAIMNSSAVAEVDIYLHAKRKGVCQIEVKPVLLEFSTPVGYTDSKQVQVRNIGEAPCLLTNIAVTESSQGAFFINAADLPDMSTPGYNLGTGRAIYVPVNFAPLAFVHTDGSFVEGDATVTYIFDATSMSQADETVDLKGFVEVMAPPCIHLEPQEGTDWMGAFPVAGPGLRFGMTELHSMTSRIMTVSNCGDEDLFFGVATGMVWPPCGPLLGLICPEYTFSPALPQYGITIPRGGSWDLEVLFNPTVEGTVETWSLVVTSNALVTDMPNVTPLDAGGGLTTVNFGLSGTGADRDIDVLPSKVDFGLITLDCCSRDEVVTVYDTGELDLTINEIRMSVGSDSGFQLRSLPSLPYQLVGGSSMTFKVRYCAPAEGPEGPYTGTIEIVSDDANENVLVVPVQAEATTMVHQIDNFHQNEKPTVDILWVVDCSGSMGEEQDNLGNNFDTFINVATSWNADIQVGVTSCSMEDAGHSGKLIGNPKVIKYGGANSMSRSAAISAFASNVDLGTSCSGTEKGLDAGQTALSPPLITDPAENAEFLRENAALVIVFVSDEEDQSIPDKSFFVDFFRDIKGARNIEMLQVYGIVGDCPGGCTGNYGEAAEGCRYSDVADQCNGFFYSICEPDWTVIYEDIGNRAFGLRRQFFLTREADPATIVVEVNGTVLTTGWVYDEESNAVIFDDPPTAGSDIKIEYDALCRH